MAEEIQEAVQIIRVAYDGIEIALLLYGSSQPAYYDNSHMTVSVSHALIILPVSCILLYFVAV